MGVRHVCAYIPLDLYEQLLKVKAETGKSIAPIPLAITVSVSKP